MHKNPSLFSKHNSGSCLQRKLETQTDFHQQEQIRLPAIAALATHHSILCCTLALLEIIF